MAFGQDSRRYLLSDESNFEPGHSPQPSFPDYNQFDANMSSQYQAQHSTAPPPQFPMPSPQPNQQQFAYPFADSAQDVYPPAEAPVQKRSKWRTFLVGSQEMIKKRWPRYFFLVSVCQAIICIAFESYTWGKFRSGVDEQTADHTNEEGQAQLKTIPTFLSLFMLGFIYEVILTWDALIAKNTIQIIGVCIANVALLVYTSIQISDISDSIETLRTLNIFRDMGIWAGVRPLLVAIPCVLSLGTVLLGFMAWKLYQEFAWDILKHIGADYRMKKRFLHYQVYIALLKFDFFFFIGFTIQFLIVVGTRSVAEKALTAAAIPITMIILLSAAWFTRREWKAGVYGVIVLYLGGLAYFIFKLSRIYTPGYIEDYKPVAKSLTTFAVLTIILIILTITNAFICMFNFGHGLKQHLLAPKTTLDKDQVSYSLSDVKQSAGPSRMTID